MTNELESLADSISKHYEISSVFLIAYDLDREEEIETKDLNAAKKLLSTCRNKRGLVIVEGVGGLTLAGQQLGHMLRRQFKAQMVSAVPKLAGSALMYPVLYSGAILASQESKISPVDPYMYHNGRMIRCIQLLNHIDRDVRKKARRVYEDEANFTYQLLSTQGCIIGRELDLDAIEKMVRILIFTPTHKPSINIDIMKEIGFTVIDTDSSDVGWLGVTTLIEKMRNYIKGNKLRGCVFLDGQIRDLP